MEKQTKSNKEQMFSCNKSIDANRYMEFTPKIYGTFFKEQPKNKNKTLPPLRNGSSDCRSDKLIVE